MAARARTCARSLHAFQATNPPETKPPTYQPTKKGWRGFAIDQRLFPNDAAVFEHVDAGTLRAHLFR